MSATVTLYLIHIEPAYAAPIGDSDRVKTAGHYLGSTGTTAELRLAEHAAGRGSPLLRAAVAADCELELVAVGAGGRDAERELKRAHHHARYCPRCSTNPKPLAQREAQAHA